jgi:probable HAF family extracellular repeat protein
MKRFKFLLVAAVLVLTPWQQGVRAGAARYTIERLGGVSGVMPTVSGMNADGTVAGSVETENGLRAVRYVNGRGWEFVPGLETAIFSQANGINAAGEIVGLYFMINSSGDLVFQGFRYSDADGLVDVGPVAGGSGSVAWAINNRGEAVGSSTMPSGDIGFSALRGAAAVGLPIGGLGTTACGINDSRFVAGSWTPSSAPHAFLYHMGDPTAVDIPLLSSGGFAQACAIDADGRVGGQASVQGGATHAFVYANGAVKDIDTFGSSVSNVESIAAGKSVGWYTVAGKHSAFVHTDADGSKDLNALVDDAAGWVLSDAKGVSANGMIVGEGTFNGVPSVFRLTPIAASADTTAPVFTSLTATPSLISPPKGQLVTVTLTPIATDDSGQAPSCGLTNLTGPATAPGDFTITAQHTGTVRAVSGRTYVFTETCTDGAGNFATRSVDVVVATDSTAPMINSISATPSVIAPPNGQTVNVTVSISATDDVDDAPLCSLSSVSGRDVIITGPHAATVLAVGGRTYVFTETCVDAARNFSTKSVDVVVPADVTAPVINAISATPSVIAPPKGQRVNVAVSVSATDDVDAAPSCSLTSITGGEAAITGPHAGVVLAVGGRTYVFTETCMDAARNSAARSVEVLVPADTTAPVINAMSATPSVIFPPNGQAVPVSVSISATDDVDDAPSCSLSSISGPGVLATDFVITGRHTATVLAIGGRTYVFTETCVDAARNAARQSVRVVVPPDTTAPVIGPISVSPNSVWPPNNKMVPVSVYVSATDNVDAAPSCSIVAIEGGVAGDTQITDALAANVRASKNDDGSGRVYRLKVNCSDRAGNTSTAFVCVYIWKDQPATTTTAAVSSKK